MTAVRNGPMNRLEDFNQYRSLLFAIAYRMLGSVMDAEDMVQETFLRWQQVSEQAIKSTKAYLTAIITRLCIDHLRSARVQREQYVGPWLPEPIVTEKSADPIALAELSDSLAMAFLVLLERLSPLERAVFLLREVFDYGYEEIGRMVEKSPANCRQIARRARLHLAHEKSRFQTPPEQQEQLTQQFIQAFGQGDLTGLLNILADDVTFWSDGGGKVTAALKPLQGAQKVAGFLKALHRRAGKLGEVRQAERVQINGQTGILYSVAGEIDTVATLEVIDNRIQAIYFVRNPDKLQRC
ncbi:MAG: RNA polymerase sigma-70 factor [Leptolyngbyaceae cyanobacterium MO_188.B28]|nr:RNA polymerase sigma-70 factor [Leptolyngbyaceae cyanobacterium MO_188.B28]